MQAIEKANWVVMVEIHGEWSHGTHSNGRPMVYKTEKSAAKAAKQLHRDMRRVYPTAIVEGFFANAEYHYKKVWDL